MLASDWWMEKRCAKYAGYHVIIADVIEITMVTRGSKINGSEYSGKSGSDVIQHGGRRSRGLGGETADQSRKRDRGLGHKTIEVRKKLHFLINFLFLQVGT